MKTSIFLIALFIVLGSFANPRGFGFGGRKAPLVLENAELLRSISREDETIRILINDVQFSQEDIYVECDYAEFYAESRKTFLRGNVFIQDSVRTLMADEVTYYEATGVAYAIGNVVLQEENNRVIRCRRLEYDYDRAVINYRGDIIIEDSTKNIIVTGQLGNYDEWTRTAEISVEPKLVKLDSLKSNPITIKGKKLWYNDSLRHARVVDNVSVTQDTMIATSNYLFFDDSTGFAELTREPKLTRGKEVITADTMYFYMKNQKIDELRALGNIVALSPADSLEEAPMNRLTGKKLYSYFEHGEAKNIIVIGNATSKYFLRENGKENGVNISSGDTLTINFKNKKITTIQVVGGVEGTFYPVGWKGEIE